MFCGSDLRRVSKILKSGTPLGLSIGAHLVKNALGPTLLSILDKTNLQFLLTNSAFLIHEIELARDGKTSEDVDSLIDKGKWGQNRITVDAYRYNLLNNNILWKDRIANLFENFPYKSYSLVYGLFK